MPIDGQNATKKEMHKIKDVCRRIKNRYKERFGRQFDWLSSFNDKIGLGVSSGYESNLGKGTAGQETVLTIYRWIIANELELAASIAPEIFHRSQVTSWQGFVERRGQYGTLHTRPFSTGGLHEISNRHPISETRIRLGQEFFFELETEITGAVIAFDHYQSAWYPIPLRGDGRFDPVKISAGAHAFPMNDRRAITPMRQRHFAGEHGHCFVVGPVDLMAYYASTFEAGQPLLASWLDQMAMRLDDVAPGKLAIHLENVIFE